MTKTKPILIPELTGFAAQLAKRGFKVFVFRSDVERVAKGGKEACATTLGFSRLVDGQECFASVSEQFGGFSFHMPIKPSREHGSGMFIGGDRANEFDDLTITNAELYASPTGSNHLVGTQKNDNAHFASIYVEVDATA